MPSTDISYCQNAECPQRKECYRFVGPEEPAPWQPTVGETVEVRRACRGQGLGVALRAVDG